MPNNIRINKARFREEPVSPDQMRAIGNAFVRSQDARLGRGHNVRGQSAPPLSPAYARKKSRMGLKPIRDWFLSGLTRRMIKVVSTAVNRVVISTTNRMAQHRIEVNQRRDKQFGVSPTDQNAILEAVRKYRKTGKAENV